MLKFPGKLNNARKDRGVIKTTRKQSSQTNDVENKLLTWLNKQTRYTDYEDFNIILVMSTLSLFFAVNSATR